MPDKKSFKYIFTETYPKRLDAFLSEQSGATRSSIQKALKKGLISVNSEIITKNGYQLLFNDSIEGFLEASPADEADKKLLPENLPLNIVYEDEYLLVINKPIGLIVHPTSHLREGTLVNALLHKYYAELSDVNDDAFRPGIVHRLDKDTSGLMVIAKTNEAHIGLAQQLESRSLKRIYWAIAVGKLKETIGSIEAPIGRHPIDRKKMAVIRDEKHKARYAKTNWEILEIFQSGNTNANLLKIRLETGRTHQIRVHFEYIGHPLLGDQTYGGKLSKTNWINRQCLHAKEIEFSHPITKENIKLQSELPEDFQFVLEKLRKMNINQT